MQPAERDLAGADLLRADMGARSAENFKGLDARQQRLRLWRCSDP